MDRITVAAAVSLAIIGLSVFGLLYIHTVYFGPRPEGMTVDLAAWVYQAFWMSLIGLLISAPIAITAAFLKIKKTILKKQTVAR